MAAAELNDSGEDALELGSDEDEEEEEKDWAAMRNTEAWLYQSGELSDVNLLLILALSALHAILTFFVVQLGSLGIFHLTYASNRWRFRLEAVYFVCKF